MSFPAGIKGGYFDEVAVRAAFPIALAPNEPTPEMLLVVFLAVTEPFVLGKGRARVKAEGVRLFGRAEIALAPKRIGFVGRVDTTATTRIHQGVVTSANVPAQFAGRYVGVLVPGSPADPAWVLERLVSFDGKGLLAGDPDFEAITRAWILGALRDSEPSSREGWSEIAERLDSVIAHDPSHAQARFLRGRAADAQGDLAGAEAHLRVAYTREPENLAYGNQLRFVLRKAGKLDEALVLAEKLEALDPQYAQGVGAVLEQQQKWEAAVAAYGRCLALGERADAWRRQACLVSRAECLMKSKRWGEALADLHAVEDKSRKNLTLWTSTCLVETGELGAAIKLLRAATRTPELDTLLKDVERKLALSARPRH